MRFRKSRGPLEVKILAWATQGSEMAINTTVGQNCPKSDATVKNDLVEKPSLAPVISVMRKSIFGNSVSS